MNKKHKLFLCAVLLLVSVFVCCSCSGAEGIYGKNIANHIKLAAEKTYGSERASLAWQGEQGVTYKVLRAENTDGTYEEIDSVKGEDGTVYYIDSKREKNKKYYYKISAADGSNQEFKVSSELVIARPTGVSAVSDGSQVRVSWTKVADASKYAVYRSATADGEFEYLGTSSSNSYVDKSEANSKKAFYKVCAFGGTYGEFIGPVSDVCEVYVKLAKPSVSSSFDKSGQYVALSWKAVKDAEKYYIYKQYAGGSYSKIGETSNLSYTEKISKNGVHQYKVAGVYTLEGKDNVGNMSNVQTIIVSSIVKNPNGKTIALTFDDGPGPYTQRIVDCLAKNNARATFFVLGQNVGRYPGAVKSAYQNGNEIANHSYSHPTLTKVSVAEIKSQYKRTDDAIAKVVGKTASLARTPGGGVNDTVKESVGKPIIMWSIDTLDWKTRDKIQTINHVMSKVRDGDIILLHDIHKPTMEAVLELIPMLKNEGYQLVTVSDLARAKGYTLQNGKVYYSFR